MPAQVNKNTTFPVKNSLVCRGKFIHPPYPLVMGILNLTPDSFYAESRIDSIDASLKKAEEMIADGAFILDIGAASSRPGAAAISTDQELDRLIPTLSALRMAFPDVLLSIDTMNAIVAKQAADCGADIINDISAGTADPEMLTAVASTGLPYILMHMKGNPHDMQKQPIYEDVVKEVLLFLSARLNAAYTTGISDVIIDPGFGFGKTVEHNYTLLNHLETFQLMNCPILAGVSRKSMINKVLNTAPAQALNGTTALHMLALQHGASILRVHDVKEAMQAIRIFTATK